MKYFWAISRPLPFVLLLIRLFYWSLSFIDSSTLLLRFYSLLKIAPQATSLWIPPENQFCSLNYADKFGSLCPTRLYQGWAKSLPTPASSPSFPYLKSHQRATKLILLVMILGCEQQKRTLTNLSKKGIYWKVIVTLSIKGEALEQAQKMGRSQRKLSRQECHQGHAQE